MVKTELFKQSGHFTKFGENNMYNLTLKEDENDANPELYSLKPMNCPESTVLYRFRPRSYRELPLRLSEIGRLHRREKSGEVNGLLRVRQITMDDAHIFATEDQIFDEVSSILDMMIEFYTKFGFEFDFRLATRPELYAGTEENWEKAEKDLEEALKKKNLKYSLKPQDGAFYGPKIDVHIKDSLGREWQLATVQLDFHQPEAFNLAYIDKDGAEKRPVMIHRAILGSFERYIGILTEHYQGAFPAWLSPVQAVILPVSDKFSNSSQKAYDALKNANIRVEVDDSNNTLGNKIREATLQKVPYMCIIGGQEESA
jgi:threonyl-tRNA synthetase